MRFIRPVVALLLSLLPVVAHAQRTLTVELGARMSIAEVASNIVSFLSRSAGIICATLVIIGALFIVVSRGEDPWKSRGQDLVIYSLVGLAIILGAAGIIRVIYFVIYG